MIPLVGLIAFAAPAQATGSGTCRALLQPELRLELVIGHTTSPVIAQVRLRDGSRLLQTGAPDGPIIAQSWVDAFVLNLELTNADASTSVARLQTFKRRGQNEYAGTLRYGGRSYQVRCRIEG